MNSKCVFTSILHLDRFNQILTGERNQPIRKQQNSKTLKMSDFYLVAQTDYLTE